MKHDVKLLHQLHETTQGLIKQKCIELLDGRQRIIVMEMDSDEDDQHCEIRLDRELVGHVMKIDDAIYEYMADIKVGSTTTRREAILRLLEYYIKEAS